MSSVHGREVEGLAIESQTNCGHLPNQKILSQSKKRRRKGRVDEFVMHLGFLRILYLSSMSFFLDSIWKFFEVREVEGGGKNFENFLGESTGQKEGKGEIALAGKTKCVHMK